jgi:hypothetical protein
VRNAGFFVETVDTHHRHSSMPTWFIIPDPVRRASGRVTSFRVARIRRNTNARKSHDHNPRSQSNSISTTNK